MTQQNLLNMLFQGRLLNFKELAQELWTKAFGGSLKTLWPE